MCNERQPILRWDDSHASSFSPNVFQVKALREEVWLLLGTARKQNSVSKDLQLQSGVRVVMTHSTAKQLSDALNTVVQRYESAYGPMDGKAPPPLRLPPFKSKEAREQVAFLLELLKNLNLTVGLERSFKASERMLLPNRFLLGFLPASIGENPHEKILDVCLRMGMPGKFFDPFTQSLPEATMVGFGIEEDETACVVKAYLEFKNRYGEALKRSPKKFDSYISHWGFKWDAAFPARSAVAKYSCFPAFTAQDIMERVTGAFYQGQEGSPSVIVRGIVELGSRKVGNDKFLYLEVNEENNPRSSFDINLYGANLRLEELYPSFLEMCRHYSIPDDQFRRLYDSVKTRTLGHIAGGLDRRGKDFLTVYFGE